MPTTFQPRLRLRRRYPALARPQVQSLPFSDSQMKHGPGADWENNPVTGEPRLRLNADGQAWCDAFLRAYPQPVKLAHEPLTNKMAGAVVAFYGADELEAACLRAVANAARRYNPDNAMNKSGKAVEGCPHGFLTAVMHSIRNELAKMLSDHNKHKARNMTTDDDSGWENIPSPEPAVDPDEARELVDALMGRAGLTTREIAILKRLAKGESSRRIGQRLGISSKAVESAASIARSKIRAVAKQGEGI